MTATLFFAFPEFGPPFPVEKPFKLGLYLRRISKTIIIITSRLLAGLCTWNGSDFTQIQAPTNTAKRAILDKAKVKMLTYVHDCPRKLIKSSRTVQAAEPIAAYSIH